MHFVLLCNLQCLKTFVVSPETRQKTAIMGGCTVVSVDNSLRCGHLCAAHYLVVVAQCCWLAVCLFMKTDEFRKGCKNIGMVNG